MKRSNFARSSARVRNTSQIIDRSNGPAVWPTNASRLDRYDAATASFNVEDIEDTEEAVGMDVGSC